MNTMDMRGLVSESGPKALHQGLRNTLQNKTNLAKLETVFQVIDLLEE
jgi:hypothetical protein